MEVSRSISSVSSSDTGLGDFGADNKSHWIPISEVDFSVIVPNSDGISQLDYHYVNPSIFIGAIYIYIYIYIYISNTLRIYHN